MRDLVKDVEFFDDFYKCKLLIINFSYIVTYCSAPFTFSFLPFFLSINSPSLLLSLSPSVHSEMCLCPHSSPLPLPPQFLPPFPTHTPFLSSSFSPLLPSSWNVHPSSFPSFPSSSPIVFSIPPSFPPSLPLLILPTLVLSPSHLPFLPLLLFLVCSFLLIYLSYHHYILPSYLYFLSSSFPCFFLLLPCSLPYPLFPPYLSPPPSSLFPYFPLSFPLPHSLCSCLLLNILI